MQMLVFAKGLVLQSTPLACNIYSFCDSNLPISSPSRRAAKLPLPMPDFINRLKEGNTSGVSVKPSVSTETAPGNEGHGKTTNVRQNKSSKV